MTQQRFGKGSMTDKSGRRSGDPRFRAIFIFLGINTVLLVWILFQQLNVSPKQTTPDRTVKEQSKEQSVIAEPPPIVQEKQTTSPAEITEPIKVEVLNGCGKSGLATSTANFLRSRGFDIRDFKNADHKMYSNTLILVRNGPRKLGEALAETIGFPLENVKMERDESLVDIDVSLILGHDYVQFILSE